MSSMQNVRIELPYQFSHRDYQLSLPQAMNSGIKRACIVWHRRAGKEKTFDKDGTRFIDHIPAPLIAGNTNSSEMKIRLQNGSILQVIGTDNVDSIVGTNPIGCVFSEYSLQNPKAWQLLRPILAENGGWAIFNFTPRGANHAKELFDMASHNKDWFCQLLTVDDTGAVTKEAIEAERQAGMSEDMIQQEFYCSFTLGVEGSYYAKYMQEAKDEDRIGKVPHAKQSRVYTVWDIGIGDSCAIIFYQIVGNEIHIIDYYETLQLRIEDGIEALRGLFPRIFIDATACKQLIKCLENYRKEFDERHQVYKTRPVHDWASHGADAARYLAIAVKRYVDSSGGPSDDDVERMKDKYQPHFK
jgi:phage terminase large subunit